MAAYFRDILQWIVGQIEADSALGALGVNDAYMYNAPESAIYPYIIMKKQTGSYEYTFSKEAYNSHWLAIKCVESGYSGGDVARQAMDRVKALINQQRPTLSSGYTMRIQASTDFETQEAESGNNIYTHVGTVYIIQLGQ